MTTEEFSNSMDTMLASHSSQAVFGEQASKTEIVLDEYEKSVLLTQAQEIIVKSFFDARLNSEGAGFDDTTKRQVDFSSLIKVKELEKYTTQTNTYDDQGILYKMPVVDGTNNIPEVLFILNEKLLYKHYKKGDLTWTEDMPGKVRRTGVIGQVKNRSQYQIKVYLTLRITEELSEREGTWYTKSVDEDTKTITVNVMHVILTDEEVESATITLNASEELFDIDFEVTLPWNTQTVLSEFSNVLIGEVDALESPYKKEYVIVPLNYKEYDRMHSRAYSQPLKKQAWRLFQNQSTGFDIQTELIPKFNVKEIDTDTEKAEFIYKIRYVKRPSPIVLEDLPEGLTINGESTETNCELNPALHIDILNKAVELAMATRGGTPAATQAASQQQRRQE